MVLEARSSLERVCSRAEVVGRGQVVLGDFGRRLQTVQAYQVGEALRTVFEMVEVGYCGLCYALKLYGMARNGRW